MMGEDTEMKDQVPPHPVEAHLYRRQFILSRRNVERACNRLAARKVLGNVDL
jgi:hypothetical protein